MARKVFSTVAHTRPSADEDMASGPEPTPPVTSRPPDVETPGRPEVKASADEPGAAGDTAARIAFTWRLSPHQVDQLDMLTLRLRRQLGRGRLDKAAVLLALVQLADDSDEVRAAVLAKLKAS